MPATRSSDQRGLTLIELVLGIMVGLIVLAGAGSVYLTTQWNYQTGERKLRAQQEATLLASYLNRQIRVGSQYEIYVVPDRTTLADSGNGLAIRDQAGNLAARIEWSAGLATLVDSSGNRVTATTLDDVLFRRDPVQPRAVRYRYRVDDLRGNFVDIQSSASLRN